MHTIITDMNDNRSFYKTFAELIKPFGKTFFIDVDRRKLMIFTRGNKVRLEFGGTLEDCNKRVNILNIECELIPGVHSNVTPLITMENINVDLDDARFQDFSQENISFVTDPYNTPGSMSLAKYIRTSLQMGETIEFTKDICFNTECNAEIYDNTYENFITNFAAIVSVLGVSFFRDSKINNELFELLTIDDEKIVAGIGVHINGQDNPLYIKFESKAVGSGKVELFYELLYDGGQSNTQLCSACVEFDPEDYDKIPSITYKLFHSVNDYIGRIKRAEF